MTCKVCNHIHHLKEEEEEEEKEKGEGEMTPQFALVLPLERD